MSYFETIRDFPDYEISASNSDIRRRGSNDVKRHVEKFIGRKKIELMKAGKRYNRLVAELMYQTFIGDVPVGKNIYLKNGRDTEIFGIDDIEALTKAEKVAIDKEYRKGLLHHGWREHPLYKNHMVNEAGQVYGLYRGKVQAGHVREDGYVDLGIDGQTKSYHRFIWEAWNNSVLDNNIEIDHINKNTQDNRPSNLQPLTKPEHNAKTFFESADNRRAICSVKASKPVVRTPINEKGEFVGDDERFSSLTEAGNITGFCRKEIGQNIGMAWAGFFWRYDDVQHLDGEIWKDFKGVQVSNLGRIKRHEFPITIGEKHTSGEFYIYNKLWDPKKYLVKRLVCEAFNGPPPNGQKPEVSRRDGNKDNNRADNLFWSTLDIRMETSKNVFPIIACYKDDQSVYMYDSSEYIFKTATAASKHFRHDSKNIGTICKEGSNCRLKVNDRAVDFFYRKDVTLETREGKLFIKSTARPTKGDKRFRN